jgi:preprotein translocase subunit YajC
MQPNDLVMTPDGLLGYVAAIAADGKITVAIANTQTHAIYESADDLAPVADAAEVASARAGAERAQAALVERRRARARKEG